MRGFPVLNESINTSESDLLHALNYHAYLPFENPLYPASHFAHSPHVSKPRFREMSEADLLH